MYPTVHNRAHVAVHQDRFTCAELAALLGVEPEAEWLNAETDYHELTSWGRGSQTSPERPLADHVTELLDLIETRPGSWDEIRRQPGYFGEMSTDYRASDDAFDDEPAYLPAAIIERLAAHGLQSHIEHFGPWNWHRINYDDWDDNRPEHCHGFSVGVRVPAPSADPCRWAKAPLDATVTEDGILVVRLDEGPAEGPYPLVRRKLSLVLDALAAQRDAWLALANAAEALVECTYIGTGEEGGLLLCQLLVRRMADLRLGLSAHFALTASFKHVSDLPCDEA